MAIDLEDDGWDPQELELARQQSLQDNAEPLLSNGRGLNEKKRRAEEDLEETRAIKKFAPLAQESYENPDSQRGIAPQTMITSANGQMRSSGSIPEMDFSKRSTDSLRSSTNPDLTSLMSSKPHSSFSGADTPPTPGSSATSSPTRSVGDIRSNVSSTSSSTTKKSKSLDKDAIDDFERQWQAALQESKNMAENEAETTRRLNIFLDKLQEEEDHNVAMRMQEAESMDVDIEGLLDEEEIAMPQKANDEPKKSPKSQKTLEPKKNQEPKKTMDQQQQQGQPQEDQQQVQEEAAAGRLQSNDQISRPVNPSLIFDEEEDMDVIGNDAAMDVSSRPLPVTPPILQQERPPTTPLTPEQDTSSGVLKSSASEMASRKMAFDDHFRNLFNFSKEMASSQKEGAGRALDVRLERFLSATEASKAAPTPTRTLPALTTATSNPTAATATSTATAALKTPVQVPLKRTATTASSKPISSSPASGSPPSALNLQKSAPLSTQGQIPPKALVKMPTPQGIGAKSVVATAKPTASASWSAELMDGQTLSDSEGEENEMRSSNPELSNSQNATKASTNVSANLPKATSQNATTATAPPVLPLGGVAIASRSSKASASAKVASPALAALTASTAAPSPLTSNSASSTQINKVPGISTATEAQQETMDGSPRGSVSTREKPIRWTGEEEIILEEIAFSSYHSSPTQRISWKRISEVLPHRTLGSIKQHFDILKRQGKLPWYTQKKGNIPSDSGALSEPSDPATTPSAPSSARPSLVSSSSSVSLASSSTAVPSQPNFSSAQPSTAAPNPQTPSFTAKPTSTQANRPAAPLSAHAAKPAAAASAAASSIKATSSAVLPATVPPPVAQVAAPPPPALVPEPAVTEAAKPQPPAGEFRPTPAQDALYDDEWEVF